MKPPARQTKIASQSPRKNKLGCIPVAIGVILLFIILNTLSAFTGYSLLDVVSLFRPKLSDKQIDVLIQPIEPKGYTYPNPSAEAKVRVVNCADLYSLSEFPRTNPLCLNVFQTTPEEITETLSSGTYDRLVLYAELSVFDAPTSSDVTDNYITDLYNTVKFMDRIAIPKFLEAYGLPDVSYIATKPYPYLYYRISAIDESDSMCNQGDTTEQIQGCARNYSVSIIPLSAIGPQMSSALPVLRKTDNKRFSYLTHYPSDCYANGIFIHETSHLFNSAVQSETGKPVMELWLNEQIAGYFRIYGAELACGKGTVTLQKNPDEKDVPKALAEFNSVFAAASLSHSYPDDSVCRQALLTEWYRYLSKGDYRKNFQRFFVEQRATKPSIIEDSALASLLLSLDADAQSKAFLTSHGCSLVVP